MTRNVKTATITNMLKARIKIGDGEVVDTFLGYGLVYLDSDKRTAAPSKGFESTSYPEDEGTHIIPKTVDDAFEYKVKFFIQASSLENANEKIVAFNNALYDYVLDENDQPTDVKEYKQVEFYNDYKRHKIVGYPEPISEPTEFWRDPKNQVNDVVVVEWTIRVNKPSLCDFALEPPTDEQD